MGYSVLRKDSTNKKKRMPRHGRDGRSYSMTGEAAKEGRRQSPCRSDLCSRPDRTISDVHHYYILFIIPDKNLDGTSRRGPCTRDKDLAQIYRVCFVS